MRDGIDHEHDPSFAFGDIPVCQVRERGFKFHAAESPLHVGSGVA